jgi:hypothetical protein
MSSPNTNLDRIKLGRMRNHLHGYTLPRHLLMGFVHGTERIAYWETWVPDGITSIVIEKAYRKIADSSLATSRQLADFITKELGVKYAPSEATKLLREPLYAGRYKAWPSSKVDGYIQSKLVKAIVSVELWESATSRMMQEGL